MRCYPHTYERNNRLFSNLFRDVPVDESVLEYHILHIVNRRAKHPFVRPFVQIFRLHCIRQWARAVSCLHKKNPGDRRFLFPCWQIFPLRRSSRTCGNLPSRESLRCTKSTGIERKEGFSYVHVSLLHRPSCNRVATSVAGNQNSAPILTHFCVTQSAVISLICVLSVLKPASITRLGPLPRWEYDNLPFLSWLSHQNACRCKGWTWRANSHVRIPVYVHEVSVREFM